MNSKRLIILSDNQTLKNNIDKILEPYNYRITNTRNLKEALQNKDIILLDEEFLASHNSFFSEEFKGKKPSCRIIYLTNSINPSRKYDFMNHFAVNYITKSQLSGPALINCIEHVEQARELKHKIANQEKKYASLFYYSIDAAFFLSPEWEIEDMNQAFRKLFGIEKEDSVPFQSLFNNADDYENLRMEFLRGATHIKKEINFNKTNPKAVFPGRLKISKLTDDSALKSSLNILGYHGMVQNISYKKRLQMIKENSNRLAMTHRWSRILAHEIRNPLTTIALATDQLESESVDNIEKKLYLDIIKRGTSRIEDLISRLLRSSEQKTFKFSEFDIIQILQSAVNQSKDRAKMENIELITDFEQDTAMYFCDSEKLQLAISNLITNAIECIKPGKRGRIIVGQYLENNNLYVYVEDNGTGMTEEEEEKLFDPFFTKKQNGMGLGLTETFSIISEHNGHIEVNTLPDLGTTFTILLPPVLSKKVLATEQDFIAKKQ